LTGDVAVFVQSQSTVTFRHNKAFREQQHPKNKIEPTNIKLTSALQLEREAKSETALAIIFMMIDSVGVVSKRTSKNYESMVA
jgi:hypothetical protein